MHEDFLKELVCLLTQIMQIINFFEKHGANRDTMLSYAKGHMINNFSCNTVERVYLRTIVPELH